MGDLSNAPFNDRVDKLNQHLHVASNLARTIAHILSNATAVDTQAQLKLLSELEINKLAEV